MHSNLPYLLGDAGGHISDATIGGCSQLVGPIGEALDAVFDTKIVQNEVYRHRKRSVNREPNVARFLQLLTNEQLFEAREGRHYRAFPNFTYQETVQHPEKFTPKMKALSKKLDRNRRIVIHL